MVCSQNRKCDLAKANTGGWIGEKDYNIVYNKTDATGFVQRCGKSEINVQMYTRRLANMMVPVVELKMYIVCR